MASVTVTVTGVVGASQIGTVLVWGDIIPVQTPSWANVDTTEANGWATVNPIQTTNWADINA